MGRAILIIGGAALLLGIWIYSILDAAQTDRLRVRTLPKGAWLAVLVLFPLLGSVLWFWLGRPRKSKYGSFGAPAQGQPPVAPDDDPEFLKFLEARARRERQDAEWQQRKQEKEKRKDADTQPPASGQGTSSSESAEAQPDEDEEPGGQRPGS